MVTIVLIATADMDVLPGLDGRGGTDDSDEVPVAANLDAQDPEAGVGAVEGHALDQPGQGFAFGFGVDLGLHGLANRVLGSEDVLDEGTP
jgi:hypothetical protein